MPVSFSDLQLAFQFVTSGGMGENEAYLAFSQKLGLEANRRPLANNLSPRNANTSSAAVAQEP
jgi:hypothetical protein